MTAAKTPVEKESAESRRIAIVSPGMKPATEVPPQTPLRAMSVQSVQVAVKGPSKPLTTKALDSVSVFGSALFTFVKTSAPGELSEQLVPFGMYPAAHVKTEAIGQLFDPPPEPA